MKIPFTKLHQQYLDCKLEIDAAIADTIASSSFITGPDVTTFELEIANYVGAEDCASTGSGTMALLCSLRAAGIGPGDEVIVPTLTFTSTAEVVRYLGADPVFVDCDLATLCLDISQIESKITPKTNVL